MQKKKTFERKPEAQETLNAAMNRILDAFERGELAEPLAQTYLRGGRHAERWGIWNQILVAIAGAEDAATSKQWQEMGRVVTDPDPVNKIWLMNPLYGYFTAEDDDGNEEKRRWIKGFGHFAVYPYSVTAAIPGWHGQSYEDAFKLEDRTAFIRGLPLIDVADAWGINVATYGGHSGGAMGVIQPQSHKIGLGTANWSTWTHELVHAAEFRLGALTKSGQDREQEIVAEWGGAVLLTMLGYEHEADWGGAMGYVRSYAKDKTPEGLVKEVRSLAGRVQRAIDLILETAQVQAPEMVPVLA